MKFLYKPFGLLFGVLAGWLASKVFQFVWGQFDDEEPPGPTTQHAPIGKVMGAAALEGLVFRSTRAAVDRYGARGFEYLTGIWPGEKEPDKAGF